MSKLNIVIILVTLTLICSCKTVVERTPLKVLIGKHRAVFTAPPTKIPVSHSIDAPMLGNGYTGVAISGNPEKQVYYLARNDFWRLKSSLNESFPAVLGKIEIDIPALKGASYRIEQDLYSAETYADFSKNKQHVQFKTFVSAVEDLMLVEIQMTGDGTMEGTVNLELPGKEEFVDRPPFDLIFEDNTEKSKTDNGVHYISRAFVNDVDIPTKAVCALNILGNDSNKFTLSKNEKIIIAVAFSSNFKSKNCLQDVKTRVTDLGESEIKNIEVGHKSWWKDFWSKSYVDINDSIIEKQYYLSNYSMASFSRDKDFPPSIFGTCITKERPDWNGDYHLNYNHFAPYYGLFSSNHIEQAIPSNHTMLAQIDRGNYYSKKVCGIEGGIILPVGAGPLGIETTRRNEMMEKFRSNWITNGDVQDEGLFYGQKSNSAYAVTNMAMLFYSTYDIEVSTSYYPFVKGVATFWENYLSFEDGRYVIYNDAIHEGTIGTVNPILSLGLVRLVMQTSIDMSKELNVDSDRIQKWQHIIDNLSNYTFQEREGKKVFRYSEKGTDWWGDNTLGIQHIYPGGQIGLDSDPELLQVAHNTIDVMQRWIDFNGSNSFFPAAVRIGYNPDTILTQLNKYSKNTYANGFQLNNPHGIENLSTVPNTINEMLCMGHGGVLRVFPVWPKSKDARFHKLRIVGAFLVSSELKNGKVQSIEVFSEKGKTLNLLNPWEGKAVTVIRNNGKKEIFQGERLKIETSDGEKILIKP
ncbi:hypothetical protein [uncultured Kriegella sp.]|uniref:glycosyl hydrolase family 95 catalytic domain-containing protein n=1 Tax=uncultured Kriegella sp. TaxID=1798910 RepID=UPI0030DA9698|tara:strand:+ start:255849 stop:258098 length:2250 start_codon:yes stop_codon:yes gene_type:complete